MAYDRFTAVDENNQFPPGVDVVKRTGDTMTGTLAISESTVQGVAEVAGVALSDKGFLGSYGPLDGLIAWKADITNGFTNLTIDHPTEPDHAATKGYVDGLFGNDGRLTIQRGVQAIPWRAFEAGSTEVITAPYPIPFTETPYVVASVRTQFNSGDGYYGPGGSSPGDAVTVQIGNRGSLTSASFHVHFPRLFQVSNNGWAVVWHAIGPTT